MTHLLGEHYENGHVPLVSLQTLHTHQQFASTLRLQRGHQRRLRRQPDRAQAVRVQMADDLSPALVLGCFVVGACLLALVAFALIQLGARLLELVRHIGGL